MLVEEVLHFFVVAWEGGGGDCDYIAVLVLALGGDFVDGLDGGEVEVEDSKLGELFWWYGAAGVVRLALVALVVGLEIGVVVEGCGRSAYG